MTLTEAGHFLKVMQVFLVSTDSPRYMILSQKNLLEREPSFWCRPIFQHIGFFCWEPLGFAPLPLCEQHWCKVCEKEENSLHLTVIRYVPLILLWPKLPKILPHQIFKLQKIKERHHKKGLEVIRSIGCRFSTLNYLKGKHLIVIDHRVQSSSAYCKCTVLSNYILISFLPTTKHHPVYKCLTCRFSCFWTVLNISKKANIIKFIDDKQFCSLHGPSSIF